MQNPWCSPICKGFLPSRVALRARDIAQLQRLMLRLYSSVLACMHPWFPCPGLQNESDVFRFIGSIIEGNHPGRQGGILKNVVAYVVMSVEACGCIQEGSIASSSGQPVPSPLTTVRRKEGIQMWRCPEGLQRWTRISEA